MSGHGWERNVPDRVDISVVVPCLNEEENLPVLAERLFLAAEALAASASNSSRLTTAASTTPGMSSRDSQNCRAAR